MTAQTGPTAPYRHVYVHVPFCARRCSYCDFAIAVRREVPVEAYVRGIAREIAIRGVSVDARGLNTLYLGGGTPSLLGTAGVAELLNVLRDAMPIRDGAEVTLEANPEDISERSVRAWREAGVTRLSIGVQSFSDQVLRWMHRVHDADSAQRAVRTARDGGLQAFSIDLIFAVPDVLGRDWSHDVDAALSLEPDHISLYGLTVEPHTPVGRWRTRGEVVESSEERYAEEFLLAHERLVAAGYEHYEVSNFARPGCRAVHNSAYWSLAPYLGMGPSAHGFNGVSRRWNTAAYAAWEASVSALVDPVAGCETLTQENRDVERAYLGLRTRDGMQLSEIEADAVTRWVDAGWIEWVGEARDRRVRCSPQGWLRLDRLAADLTAVPSHS